LKEEIDRTAAIAADQHQSNSNRNKKNATQTCDRNKKTTQVDFQVGGGQQNAKSSADNKDKIESLARDPNEVVCFNCDQPGHYRKGCAAPRRLRCYKCKTVGYTTRDCPKGSGNAGEKQ
ncbi:zinc finger protein GIS2-like, partial [Belonocnema kinseyi]|uniref:zinc finger protein GIS2-like n=1 Tax=Belonocnema kinseyi TaxID=2817044 RepID=UPI00143D2EFB